MEEEIIQPIDRELLKRELTPERQLRMTNKSHNEIYVVTAKEAPNVMKEIGRLREEAFRTAGGGTGKSMDIDEFDTMDHGCKQLIVWNPENDEIIGGYRYLFGKDWKIQPDGQPHLATSHMFHFSRKFMREYAPYTVELGRSFVSLDYQNVRQNTKSIFALDNLWDGLGALTVINPDCKYFFGKMTMYSNYIRRGRDMILYFLKKHFDDKENLIIPIKPLKIETPEEELRKIFCEDDFKADYRILNHEIRKLGYNIPPHHETLRHSHQLRLRRRGGDGHPDSRGRDIRGEAHTPHRELREGTPRGPAPHQRRKQLDLQGKITLSPNKTQPISAVPFFNELLELLECVFD